MSTATIINWIIIVLLVLFVLTEIVKLIRDMIMERKIKIALASPQFQLEKDKFYTSLDLKKINDAVDEYIKSNLELYMLNSGLSTQPNLYLSDNDIKKIIKEVTKEVIDNMSDVYRSYISLLHRVDDMEDFDFGTIVFIRNKVRDQVILLAKDINSPK